MIAKQLIKNRNLRFLHPDVVQNADDTNVAAILKAVGYFRNFAIFKVLYTLLYKSKHLTLEQFRNCHEILVDYKATHPKDYFIDGFSLALAKSNVNGDVKALYAIMIYDHLYNDGLFDSVINKTGKRIGKSVADYYRLNKAINVAIIRDYKVMKIGNRNIVKSVVKWTRS